MYVGVMVFSTFRLGFIFLFFAFLYFVLGSMFSGVVTKSI